MNIMITGATGYIGHELVRALINQGNTLHIIYRGASAYKLNDLPVFQKQTDHIKFFEGDLTDQAVLEKAMDGCSQVYHVAALAKAWAKDESIFDEVNIEGTRKVLEAAKNTGVKRVVFTSSGGTLAESNHEPADEETPRSDFFYNPYERTKYQAEQVVKNFASNDLETVIVNPTRVFGPGLLTVSNAATRLISYYIQGKWHFVLGNGKAVGSYVYVKDVIDGHLLAMKHGRSGEQYILGGENLSFNEYFNTIGEVAGEKQKLFGIPISLAITFARFQTLKAKLTGKPPMITPDWVTKYSKNWACSSEKAKKELGYTITPFKQALEETIEWLRKNRLI